MALIVICTACSTYQAAGAFEPRGNNTAAGVVFAGDSSEYFESSLSYFPDMAPDQNQIKEPAIGLDFNLKIPFHFAGNHFSVFPILGFSSRLIFNNSLYGDEEEEIYNSDNMKDSPLGMGLLAGLGFDISFTPEFFLRGKILYQPEFTTFFNNYQGVRLGIALGYRTTDDDVRRGYKTFRAIKLEKALKNAKESFDKKNYSDAIRFYQQVVDMGSSLGDTGITNFSTAYYERAKENRSKGDYRQAAADINESVRLQYFMSRQKYTDWLDIMKRYNETYNSAPSHGGYAKLIFPSNDNMTISYDRSANGQTSKNEILGSGWNLNLQSGARVFYLKYDEPNFDNGIMMSDSIRVTFDAEEGHIYRAESIVTNGQVTIRIIDVTNSELDQDLNIGTVIVFNRTIPLREEKPRTQSVRINISNNTGYTIRNAYLIPSDVDISNIKPSDFITTEFGGYLRNRNSRNVTFHSINLSKKYHLMLVDTDDDFYFKYSLTITPNMSVNFTISDFL